MIVMKTRCPICKKVIEKKDQKLFPFCSQRCRLVDLGQWFDEGYKIVAGNEESDLDDEDSSN